MIDRETKRKAQIETDRQKQRRHTDSQIERRR